MHLALVNDRSGKVLHEQEPDMFRRQLVDRINKYCPRVAPLRGEYIKALNKAFDELVEEYKGNSIRV